MFSPSGPRVGGCSGWTGRGRLRSWDTQPGFRRVSPRKEGPGGCFVSSALASRPVLGAEGAAARPSGPWEHQLDPAPEGPVGCARSRASFSARLRILLTQRMRSNTPASPCPSLSGPKHPLGAFVLAPRGPVWPVVAGSSPSPADGGGGWISVSPGANPSPPRAPRSVPLPSAVRNKLILFFPL